MQGIVIVLTVLAIVPSGEATPPTTGNPPADPAAKVNASEGLVRRALIDESLGRLAGRDAALREAVRIDPENVAAHGLLGEVSYRGRWQAPEEVGRAFAREEARGHARRVRPPPRPDRGRLRIRALGDRGKKVTRR